MSVEPMFNPLLAHRLAISSVGIPDPIEFVISEKFLDRGVLYPRQATLLKTIFLRDDLFCADEETQILTRRGWVHYWDLVEGEDVMTLREDGLSEWAPAQRVNVFPVVDEPMVLMQGEGHSSLTTPNHRWLSLIHISEPTRRHHVSRMPSSA